MKDVRIEFANFCAMLASRLSINSTCGQIYGYLFLSKEPVSLDEIVSALNISKGSVSTNIRILEGWGAVRKVWVSNSRKDFYEANPDVMGVALERIKEGLRKRISEAEVWFGEIEKEISKKENEFFKKKIAYLKEIKSRIVLLLEFLENKGNNLL